MSVDFVSSRQITSGGSNVASQSILLPDGWVNDDICLWFGIINNGTYTLTLPSTGWNYVDTSPFVLASSQLWVAWQRMSATSASPAISIGSGGCKATQSMLVYRGASKTNAPIVGARATRASSSATTTGVGLTTTEANQVVTTIFMEKSTSSTTATLPVGPTVRTNLFATGGGEVSTISIDEVVATVGATGTRAATYDVASTVGYALSVTFEAAPVVAPSTGSKVYSLASGALAQRSMYRLDGGALS